jgi:hypothetical protein
MTIFSRPKLAALPLMFFCHFAAAASLCTTSEQEIFSCTVGDAKPKIVSLCSADAQGKEQPDYLAYRFGTKAKVELQYPESLDKSALKKFRYFSYRSTSVDNYSVSFKNGNTNYEITRSKDLDDKDGAPDYFLDVTLASKKTVHLDCQEKGIVDNLPRTSNFLACDSGDAGLNKFCK